MRNQFSKLALAILVAAGIGCSMGLASDADAAAPKSQVKSWKPQIGAFTGDPDIGSNKNPPPGSIHRRPNFGDDTQPIQPPHWRWWWELRGKFQFGGW